MPLVGKGVYGQVPGSIFLPEQERPDSLNDRIYIGMDYFFYFRNNEYYQPFADGLTLIGNHLQPSVVFCVTPGIRFSAGVFLRQDFGSEGFREAEPALGIEIEKWGIVSRFGKLRGNLLHRLPLPVYSFERALEDPLEFGYQTVLEKKNLFLDTWVHWENMIQRYDDKQEMIWGGLSSVWAPFSPGNFRIEIPFHITATHHGGQIDTSDMPVYTLWNIGGGLGLYLSGTATSFIRETGLNAMYLGSYQRSSGGLNPYKKGSGVYLNLAVSSRLVDVGLSYWKGNSYYSELGDPLYSSVGRKVNREGFTEENRELFFLRISKDIRVAGALWLSFRFEPFLDTRYGMDFSHGIYARYNCFFNIPRSASGSRQMW